MLNYFSTQAGRNHCQYGHSPWQELSMQFSCTRAAGQSFVYRLRLAIVLIYWTEQEQAHRNRYWQSRYNSLVRTTHVHHREAIFWRNHCTRKPHGRHWRRHPESWSEFDKTGSILERQSVSEVWYPTQLFVTSRRLSAWLYFIARQAFMCQYNQNNDCNHLHAY